MISYTNVEALSDSTLDPKIRRCLIMLWTTPTGTVVLDRDFGLDTSFIDEPLPKAKQMYSIEIITKTRKYEPRVNVQSISFEIDPLNGKLNPKVKVIQVGE